jgi:integrase
VCALLASAYEDGHLRTNPAIGVRVVLKDRRPRKPKWLSAEQTRRLLAAMPANDADLASLLAATGCRISEALAALWHDIGANEDGRIVLTIPEGQDARWRTHDPAVARDSPATDEATG